MSDSFSSMSTSESDETASGPADAVTEAPTDRVTDASTDAAVDAPADAMPHSTPAASSAPTSPAAPADVPPPSGWPWDCLHQPAVIESEQTAGTIDATGVAAVDFAIITTCRALSHVLGQPVQGRLASAVDAQAFADVAGRGYGFALAYPSINLEALVMFEPQLVRLLASAIAMQQGGSPATAAPGPIAEAGEVEQGLIEYFTLLTLDRVLRLAGINAQSPVIEAFCDANGARNWLGRHQANPITLELTLAGGTGQAQIHLHGISGAAHAALSGTLARLDRIEDVDRQISVSLALPAVMLTAQEFTSMAVGDVLLLGGSSLHALPLGCELVTGTHWSLGRAQVSHDTPTYLNIMWTHGRPAARAAAVMVAAGGAAGAGGSGGEVVVQPIVGIAQMPLHELLTRSENEPLQLSKDPIAPVGLYHGLRRMAEGEFIVLGSELGVRVVAMVGD